MLTAAATGTEARFHPSPEVAIRALWSSGKPGGVATAATADEARHAAVGLALLAPRGAVLVEDEAMRIAFRSLPPSTDLHDLGEIPTPELGPPRRAFAVVATGRSAPAIGPLPEALRAWPNRFLGRHAELDAVTKALAGHRLVTLVGLPGAGLSRLAAVAAARWAAGTARDVVVSADGDVPDAALVITDAGEVGADALRRLPPRARLLAVGPDPLGADGEQVITVRGLAVEEAAELYRDRTAQGLARGAGGRASDPTVEALVARLDGSPLAIEAAARLATVAGPAELLYVLDVAGVGGVPALAAIAHAAVDGLDEPASGVLAALLGVDVDLSLDGVAAVSGRPPAETLLALEALDRRGLVAVVAGRAGHRYSPTASARATAGERGSAAAFADRLVDHLAVLTAQADAELTGSEAAMWLERLGDEEHAIQQVLDVGLAAGDVRTVEVAVNLWRAWYLQGRVAKGRQILRRAGASGAAVPADLQARLHNAAANLATAENDAEEAVAHLARAVALRRQLGNIASLAHTLTDLGHAHERRGDHEASATAYLESAEMAQECDDKFALANATMAHASVLVHLGRAEEALDRARASIALWEQAGVEVGVAAGWSVVGGAQLALQRYDAAAASLKLTLAGLIDAGARSDIPGVLEGMAAATLGGGDPGRAAWLYGVATRLRDDLALPVAAHEADTVAQQVAETREGLGAADFDRHWAQGHDLPTDEALAAILDPEPNLLRREGDVWLLRYEGRETRIRSSRGVEHLARLLAAPGVPIAAIDLVGPGRGTAMGDAGERARKSAGKALRDTVARLHELDPRLAEHLTASLQLGTRCRYAGQAQWQVASLLSK